MDPDQVRSLMTPRTVMVSVTNPHNPTGAVIDDAVMAALVDIVEAHPQARLLVDETYREMTFGGPQILAASRSERVIGVSSLSKADGLPGIRVGWLMTRDRRLLDRFLAAKEQMVITGSVVDEAIAEVAMARRATRLPRILAGIETAFADGPRLDRHQRGLRVGRAARWGRRVPAVPVDPRRRYRPVLRGPARRPRHDRRSRPLVRPAADLVPSRLRVADRGLPRRRSGRSHGRRRDGPAALRPIPQSGSSRAPRRTSG